MPNFEPFEGHAESYDAWFDSHRHAWHSELDAVRALLPRSGSGLEIGVGTGRFAAPLGIRHGVEPSAAMRSLALERGVDAVDGVAEALPFSEGLFDFAVMVTTICFLEDVAAAFREAHRVLRPGGHLLVGFIDRASPLGRQYQWQKADSLFYRVARFHTVPEVIGLVEEAGFGGIVCRQTLFGDPAAMAVADPVLEGHGDGAFVVIRGTRR
jgi:SAM-dependent methyltransferase